jgi:3',5'-cyclic-AMP phosphodiesterase
MSNFIRFAIILLAFPSCMHVAEGRAKRDLQIGRAEKDGVSVTIGDGLANIRALTPRDLRLWAGAPAFSIELKLSAGAGGLWSFTLENVLPDAELTARTSTGEALPVTLADAPFPTEKRFEVELPSSESDTITLALRPPDEALPPPYRFAVFADVQEKLNEVQDIYSKMNQDPAIRFALISGDLTSRGSDEELTRFQREMKTLNFPCYATLGNHELGTRDEAFHDYFGRGNFRFTFRGVQFTMLDSASATLDPLVYEQLDRWLEEGKDKPHMVVMHIAPLDPIGTRNGAFASRAEADKLLLRLAEGGVDLTMYGHIHSFYAFENAGIPAYISGGGGAIPERLDGIARHYLTINVNEAGAMEEPSIVRVD